MYYATGAKSMRKVVLAVLDGVGLASDENGNAVAKARTPWLGHAVRDHMHVALEASGEAVGLLPGQMGNSEVGHSTMGAGRIIPHGIAHIEAAFRNGAVFSSEAWQGAIRQVLGDKNRGADRGVVDKTLKVCYNGEMGPRTLHFAGIFSDGGVHSHISHLEQMIEQAYSEGVRRMRIHAIFDGRDVAPMSEPKYIQRLEQFAAKFTDADIRIASGGGRMTTVADRYENDWTIVARGWDMMVNGEADYYFKTAEEAISTLRRVYPEIQDQNLPAFVIVDENEQPVGRIQKGDALIYFDFRADRAIEIAQAFTYWDFPYFNRGQYTPNDVYFAGMTEYNSDTHVPEHQLVAPIKITDTLNQVLGALGAKQLACSETVKFGHITYYFDGNSYDRAPGEEFIEIPSFAEPFEERPWMKSAEIADTVIRELEKYDFVRVNFPGGDMVGHTANMSATIVAMEAIDLALRRIAEKVDELGGVLVVTADHGNAEELVDTSGAPKTSHTTNRVPCIIYDNANDGAYQLARVEDAGLANLAATITDLLEIENRPEGWSRSLIEKND